MNLRLNSIPSWIYICQFDTTKNVINVQNLLNKGKKEVKKQKNIKKY